MCIVYWPQEPCVCWVRVHSAMRIVHWPQEPCVYWVRVLSALCTVHWPQEPCACWARVHRAPRTGHLHQEPCTQHPAPAPCTQHPAPCTVAGVSVLRCRLREERPAAPAVRAHSCRGAADQRASLRQRRLHHADDPVEEYRRVAAAGGVEGGYPG